MKIALFSASVIAAGVILAGCTGQPTTSATPEPVTSPQTNVVEALETASFTLADVAKHNKPTDCWFAYEGNVYDVTPVVQSGKHPGGAAILQGCGKDATELFNNKGKEGEPHSEQATAGLLQLKVGTLAQ